MRQRACDTPKGHGGIAQNCKRYSVSIMQNVHEYTSMLLQIRDMPVPHERHTVSTDTVSEVAFVAIMHNGHMLLTQQHRAGMAHSIALRLPGGQVQEGETRGIAAARGVHRETGEALSDGTRDAIAAITTWTKCPARGTQYVGMLELSDGACVWHDDPDTTVHTRFDRKKANANRFDITMYEGVEWHPMTSLCDPDWRKANMHDDGADMVKIITTDVGMAQQAKRARTGKPYEEV